VAKIAVIVPAAGQSTRFGDKPKKPFAILDGRAVVIRTLELFINRQDVVQTILAVSPEDVEEVKRKFGANLSFMGVNLVEGGKERYETIANALARVKAEAEFVAVHDAVRPCATEEMIDAVFAQAQKSGAAILASPVRGTLKRVGTANLIENTVSREGLWEAQTPQVFRKDWLLEAYAKRDQAPAPVTDDAQLIELFGQRVTVVESDMSNLKITSPVDLRLAQAILKGRPPAKAKGLGAFEEAQW
jgi:2-C-methyl-D-erythritol 4-phosphate cytidylyltransferase